MIPVLEPDYAQKVKKWRQYDSRKQARAKTQWIARRLRDDEISEVDGRPELQAHADLSDKEFNFDVPSLSAASPIAHYYFERSDMRAIWKLLSAMTVPLWFVTVINPRYFVELDQSPTDNLEAMEKAIKRGLA